MTFFLNSHLGLSRSLRSNENRGWIFEAATSNFCNHSWNIGSSPLNGKVDLCTTNGSIVLIYLTLLNFLLHYLQEYSKIWNIEKSNKSELWNHLSYRGLPYLFEVMSQTFRNNCKISRSQPHNSTSIVILPQWPWKAQVRSIGFLCHFLGLAWTSKQ